MGIYLSVPTICIRIAFLLKVDLILAQTENPTAPHKYLLSNGVLSKLSNKLLSKNSH